MVNTFEPTGIQEAADKGQPRVTAANASGINDGAAAIVLASGEAVEKYGLKPMAKLIGWGQGGVDPKIMGVGPVPASRQAMKKAGLTIDDIDLVEANEAFAAQSIAVARELHFDMSKVNVNGGAIALGHPVGASGARIIVTLLHEMQKRPRPSAAWPPCASAAAWALPPSTRSAEPLRRKTEQRKAAARQGGVLVVPKGQCPLGQKLAEFAARRRQSKIDPFLRRRVRRKKTLLSLQVWNLFAFSEQIMRAAD